MRTHMLACVQALTGNASSMYTLSVVRLAPPEHSRMAELNVSIKGATYSLCSDDPLAEPVPEFDEAGEPVEPTGAGLLPSPCQTDPTMWLNVSHDTDTVLLHPRLLFPHVQVSPLGAFLGTAWTLALSLSLSLSPSLSLPLSYVHMVQVSS